MKSIEESVIKALDGTDIELIPFLPYILKDFRELGTSPENIIEIVKKHASDFSTLKVLDLGCGKGAVSVKLSHELSCSCHGIDAVGGFIEEAKLKALEYKVDSLCRFETADIRLKVKELSDFDIIILGSIGPVFGNTFETLSAVKPCLRKEGFIILDEGYIEDSSSFTHPAVLKKSEVFKQIENSGMIPADEIIDFDSRETKKAYNSEFDLIVKRCEELMIKYPDKKALFKNYIDNQKKEYSYLNNKIICSTIIIKNE